MVNDDLTLQWPIKMLEHLMQDEISIYKCTFKRNFQNSELKKAFDLILFHLTKFKLQNWKHFPTPQQNKIEPKVWCNADKIDCRLFFSSESCYKWNIVLSAWPYTLGTIHILRQQGLGGLGKVYRNVCSRNIWMVPKEPSYSIRSLWCAKTILRV